MKDFSGDNQDPLSRMNKMCGKYPAISTRIPVYFSRRLLAVTIRTKIHCPGMTNTTYFLQRFTHGLCISRPARQQQGCFFVSHSPAMEKLFAPADVRIGVAGLLFIFLTCQVFCLPLSRIPVLMSWQDRLGEFAKEAGRVSFVRTANSEVVSIRKLGSTEKLHFRENTETCHKTIFR